MTADLTSYTVTRKRIKNLRVTVKAPDGAVHVSAPRYISDREIAAFVAQKAQWIAKHQERIDRMPPPLEPGPDAERLRRQLRADAVPLLAYWADRMGLAGGATGLPLPHLTIRHMKTRWGTCNIRDRRITLNLELARRDPELLEYVVVHELTHLFERGHNAHFYAVMDRYLPDWRAKRKALNGH